MENKKIAIIGGNPSVGIIEALQSRFPKISIVVVNDTQNKVDASKYQERFRGYLFDRYEQFRNGKKQYQAY
jgi:hypothetical protein